MVKRVYGKGQLRNVPLQDRLEKRSGLLKQMTAEQLAAAMEYEGPVASGNQLLPKVDRKRSQ